MDQRGTKAESGVALPTSITHVYLHFRWLVSPNGAPLTAETLARLIPYLTRYGQTLGATVVAVGGAPDHVHTLLRLPPTRTIDEVTGELQVAATRFLHEVLRVVDFAWHETNGGFVASVDANTLEALGDYIRTNWDSHVSGAIVPYWEYTDGEERETNADPPIPQWLLDALENRNNGTGR